jgi:hypothetical protein
VLRMYATWEALKPTWFTDATKAAIPDDFMPAEALRRESARAPGGRRPTVAEIGVLRRVSLAAGGSVTAFVTNSETASSIGSLSSARARAAAVEPVIVDVESEDPY